jgi:hypothetical protein
MEYLSDEALRTILNNKNVREFDYAISNDILYFNKNEVGTDKIISIFAELRMKFKNVKTSDCDESDTINKIDSFESKIYQKLTFSEKIKKNDLLTRMSKAKKN